MQSYTFNAIRSQCAKALWVFQASEAECSEIECSICYFHKGDVCLFDILKLYPNNKPKQEILDACPRTHEFEYNKETMQVTYPDKPAI